MSVAALGHVGIRKEAAFASGGSIDNYQPIDSEGIGLQRENIYGDRIQATEEQVGGITGRRKVSGPIVFGVSPQNPTQWWECGLGQSSSPHSGERPLSSLMIEVDRETGAIQTSGCMVVSLTLASAQGSGPDAELKCTAQIEGKDIGKATAGTPSFTATDAPYVHSEGAFKLNGVADDDITAWSANIANNNALELYGSDLTRQKISATKLVCTGSFTKLFETLTERDAFLNDGGARSFQVTFTRGARSFDVNVAKLKYDTAPRPLEGQTSYIMETFNWTAYVDDASSENSVVITVDTTG